MEWDWLPLPLDDPEQIHKENPPLDQEGPDQYFYRLLIDRLNLNETLVKGILSCANAVNHRAIKEALEDEVSEQLRKGEKLH